LQTFDLRSREGFRQQLFERSFDMAVAFASDGLQALAVEDRDPASVLLDQSCRLKRPGYEADSGPLHSQRLGEKFMSEGKRGIIRPVVRAQQPAAAPCFNRMDRVARNNLERLPEQGFAVAIKDVTDRGHCLGRLAKLLKAYREAVPGTWTR
jgi:hypothetical protein